MTLSAHLLDVRLYDGTILSPIQAELELNEQWSPFVRASFTLRRPTDEQLAMLDPRSNFTLSGRLAVEYRAQLRMAAITALFSAPFGAAKYTAAYGTAPLRAISDPLAPKWNAADRTTDELPYQLLVRQVDPDYLAGTVTIRATSYEAQLQDMKRLGATTTYAAGQSLRQMIRTFLADFAAGAGNLPVLGADATLGVAVDWIQGQSLWDFLDPLLQLAGLTLRCTERHQWELVTANAAPKITRTLGRVQQLQTSFNRDSEWSDSVLVKYQWTDAGGVAQLRTDVATVGGGVFQKPLIVTHTDTVYPGPGAAGRLLERAQLAGRRNQVEAVADYSWRPGVLANFTPAGLTAQRGRITAVAFSYPQNTMQLTTQEYVE